jgi:GNAT superfamily N-acetyltransferase
MPSFHSLEALAKFKKHTAPEILKSQMAWKDIFVVEDDSSEIIATGAIADFGRPEKPKYSVSNFFAKPELHGRGIGKYLFHHLLNSVKAQQIDALHVPSSKNAVPFYKKFGFIKDIEQPDINDEITWLTLKIIYK